MTERGNKARLVRPWLLVVLGLLLLASLVLFVLARRSSAPVAVDKHVQAAAERHTRVEAAAAIALAPLPTKIPIVERPGKDAWGYPLSYVDKAGLRSLLGRGKYRELSAYIEQFQADAEADFHSEYWINDCADTFESAERQIEPSLDAWVKETPDSFAPYLGRAVHRYAVGFAQRGVAWASETDADNFKGMEAAFALAFQDLEQALRIKPGLMPARRMELRIAFSGSAHKHEFKAMAARALQVCPRCFQIRATIQIGLTPRWGGSYREMTEAASSAKPGQNPRFRLLPGYLLMDRATSARLAKDKDLALSLAEQAVALGDNTDFLYELARTLSYRSDHAGALRAVNRALELRPLRKDLLFLRANLAPQQATPDWEAAHSDLIAGLRQDPADTEARQLIPYVVSGLTSLGWTLHEKGDQDNALRLLDKASELAPSRDLEGRRVAVLTQGFRGTAREILALEARANAAPHDFYAHERLDYALSKSAQWSTIAAMWAAYIAQNPEDGRAYYERAGTYMRLQQADAAHADAVRACELGVSAGCAAGAR
jgi:hypothetical protein